VSDAARLRIDLAVQVARKVISPNSQLYLDVISSAAEFRRAAVAVRVLAEHLQQHPSALSVKNR
jgi:hypothetical protein